MKHALHVLIADDCLKEAKKFSLLTPLNTLKQRIELHSNLNRFELFEFPYLMRKKFSYQYRLLVKFTKYEYAQKVYHIIIFLKIYHRGDKSYHNSYINSRQQFDVIYKQRNVEQSLQAFITKLVQQKNLRTSLPVKAHNISLTDYRSDLLNLSSQQMTQDGYYQESITWRYAIAPKLSKAQAKQYHHILQDAIKYAKSTQLDLGNDHQLNIHAPKTQLLPIIYPPNIACNMHQVPYFLGDDNSIYRRKIPLAIAVNEQHWLMAQQHQLPFELNPLQKHCIEQLFFKFARYPVVIQSASNTGKTTLLALLYSHFIVQEKMPKSSLPCLFLCQKHEQAMLHQQISSYIQQKKLQQLWQESTIAYCAQELEQLLIKSCLPICDYLLSALDKQQQAQFKADKFMDETKFYQLYHKHIKAEKNPDYDCAQLAWMVIRHVIQEQNITDDIIHNAQYQPLNQESFLFIYEKIWKAWYLPLLKSGYWDEYSLLAYIDEHEITLPYYASLLIDHSQHLSSSLMTLLLNHNYWLANNMTEQLANIPLIFSASHAPSECFHSWQPALNQALHQAKILNNMALFDEPANTQNETYTLINHIHNHHAINNAISALFYSYYQKFNINYPQNYLNIDPNHHHQTVEILWLDRQSAIFTALLQQHHLPIIINDIDNTQEQVLQSYGIAYFLHLFGKKPTDDLPFLHRLSQLPTKSDGVILLGFDLPIVDAINQPQLSQDDQSKKHLTWVMQLNKLEMALQQGLSRIYIVSDTFDFHQWQQFFGHDRIVCRQAQMPDVAQFSHIHHLERPTPYQTLDDFLACHQHKPTAFDEQALLKHLTYHQNYWQHETYWQLFALHCFVQEKFNSYWQQSQDESLHFDMFYIFWATKSFQHFVKYKSYLPPCLTAHLKAIELCQHADLSTQWLKNYLELTQDALKNDRTDIFCTTHWRQTWLDIQHQWFTQLSQTFTKFTTLTFGTLQQQLHQQSKLWIDAQLPYDANFFALLHAHIGQYQTAIDLWHNALTQQSMTRYPILYHWAKLQTIAQIEQRIDYLFSTSNKDFIAQELLTMNLNEPLRAEYWQKILDYLHDDDDDELISILEPLLPIIDSPELFDKLLKLAKLNEQHQTLHDRIQRFKTLHACLNNDWDTIIERLNDYIPPQTNTMQSLMQYQRFRNVIKNNFKNKSLGKDHHPAEVIDMLYALNLNPEFIITQNCQMLNEYQSYEHVKQIFSLLLKIFALPDNPKANATLNKLESFSGLAWKTNFDGRRALAVLMEKSPNTSDSLSIYSHILHTTNPKDADHLFALERIYVHLERIKNFDDQPEFIKKSIDALETKFKQSFKAIEAHKLSLEPPILKQPSEIMKGILSLSTQENNKIQKMERDERLAQEKIKKERLEQERLEQERLKQEKLEQERLEKERLKQERLEQERLKQEQLEKERLAQERIEKERLEQAWLEQKRLEFERLQQEQLEKERLEKERLEQEQLEKERLEQEQLGKERLEKEQLEQERLEQERLEQERLEQERLEQERLEKEHLAQENTTQKHSEMTNFARPIANLTAGQNTTSELYLFNLRIFVSKSHRRINIESNQTGESWSLNLNNGQIKSDWAYQLQQTNHYHLPLLQLNVLIFDDSVHIHYLTQGVYLQIQL